MISNIANELGVRSRVELRDGKVPILCGTRDDEKVIIIGSKIPVVFVLPARFVEQNIGVRASDRLIARRVHAKKSQFKRFLFDASKEVNKLKKEKKVKDAKD